MASFLLRYRYALCAGFLSVFFLSMVVCPSVSFAKEADAKAAEEAEKFPEWDTVIKGAKRLEGLFPLYYNEKEQKLFMEIKKSQYEKELILPIAIARGAGIRYLGGHTLNFGNQWLVSFRRAADRILVVRRNVRFKAAGGSPQADAVKVSYTDSIIKALPIKSEKGGSVLIDLADLFMVDLAGIGVHPDRTRSTWAKVKTFPENIEIEVSAVFSMYRYWWSWFFSDYSVPDRRGAQIVIHYGLSMLPKSGYKPRLADDRVGHFLDVVKDFSKDVDETPNLRYVRRWHLEKDDPSADMSPPKKPIVFWIERTVPRQYRRYVREGILEWNKAFEKVGFIDAIQVRDQQPGDTFDPEDIRYNTFRWITTSYGFAMGPSRTNPKTGEILDADIVFDEGMIRYWRQEYLRTVGLPEGTQMLLGGRRQAFFKLFASEIPWFDAAAERIDRVLAQNPKLLPEMRELQQRSAEESLASGPMVSCTHCQMGPGMQRQLGLMAAVMAARGELAADVDDSSQASDDDEGDDEEDEADTDDDGKGDENGDGKEKDEKKAKDEGKKPGKDEKKAKPKPKNGPPGGNIPEKFIAQAIKQVVMHEVGHTLGLRHNFMGSTVLSLEDINNPEITRKKGLSGSVMDYLPANIVPKGEKQGDYFSSTIGPYDYWVIEYAYKSLKGDAAKELAKIASRAAEPELIFGTDEDLWVNPDPRIHAFDLGDPLDYAKQRIRLVRNSLQGLQDRVVAKGEGWQRARKAFSLLLGELSYATYLSTTYVGGEYTARDHRGDPKSRTPLRPIEIEKQREAIKLLKEEILSAKAFDFDPELLKSLAPDHWYDDLYFLYFGQYQYPVLQRVLSIQRMVVSRMLSAETLNAIQEIELHATDKQEVLRMPEVFDALTDSIWSELPVRGADVKKQDIEINIMRRNLQREHVRRLSRMVLGPRMDLFSFYFSCFWGWEQPTPADARSLARLHLRSINGRIKTVLSKKNRKSVKLDSLTRAHLEEIRDQINKVLQASLEVNRL